jgi:hypothetical protein
MTTRPTIRQARRLRRDMLRFFRENNFVDSAERALALRKNPRLSGARKAEIFRGTLDDYAAAVTKGSQAPGAEAPDSEAGGDGSVAVHAAVAEHDPRDRPDAGAGVSNLEAEVVGDD